MDTFAVPRTARLMTPLPVLVARLVLAACDSEASGDLFGESAVPIHKPSTSHR